MTCGTHHTARASVKANNVEIVYDTLGEDNAPPLLLTIGLRAQMISWDDAFCSQLAARGYRAVPYDDRDIGLSTKSEAAGMPDIPGLIQAVTQGQTVKTA